MRLRPVPPAIALAPLLMGSLADPSAKVVIAVAIIYVTALLAGELAVRVGQPAVLGELIGGVLLGNLHLVGVGALEFIKTEPGVALLAQLGVLILLFEVGLESTVHQMMKVGLTSLVVAVLGVIAPFALGWAVGAWLLPHEGTLVHAFLGATLSATSVGITARVLKDLQRAGTTEARIILGAAVVDDVLGLVILAVVSEVIVAAGAGRTPSYASTGLIVVKAAVFMFGAIAIGGWLAPRALRWSSRLRTRGAALAVSLALCFVTAWAAYLIGLAPIVGAFAAGLVVEGQHYEAFTARGEHPIEAQLHPIVQALVPVFFVLMGMHTDLASFARTGVLGLAAALTAAAIIGKQACSLGVWGAGLNRLAIGVGMVPRGEVGLIFASIGRGLTIDGHSVISTAAYSAVVVMVVVTTMLTPPVLKWSFERRQG